MPTRSTNQISVYLVRYDIHMMAQTDFTEVFQFLFRPHSSDGIVRGAEQYSLDIVFLYFALKIFIVDFIVSFCLFQFRDNQSTTVILYDLSKRIVDRLKNQYGITLFCQRPDRTGCRVHHRRRGQYPLVLYLTGKAPAVPCAHRFDIFIIHILIAVDAVSRDLIERVFNTRSGLKIHIRHPHRNKVAQPVD